jgi:hypothetical protein
VPHNNSSQCRLISIDACGSRSIPCCRRIFVCTIAGGSIVLSTCTNVYHLDFLLLYRILCRAPLGRRATSCQVTLGSWRLFWHENLADPRRFCCSINIRRSEVKKAGGDPNFSAPRTENYSFTPRRMGKLGTNATVLAKSWCTGRKSSRDARRHRLIVDQFSQVVNIIDVVTKHGDQPTASSTSVVMSCHDYHYCIIPFWGRLVPALSRICNAVHIGLTASY